MKKPQNNEKHVTSELPTIEEFPEPEE